MPERRARRLVAFLHSSLIAGFFVALPVGITCAALAWIWDKIDGPLMRLLNITAAEGSPWARAIEGLRSSHYGQIIPPLLGLIFLLLLVLALGMIAHSIIGRVVLSYLEGLVGRVPLAGFLYSSVKQLAEAFVSKDGKAKFQSAVLVQFPVQGTWVIGFVTGSAPASLTTPISGAAAKATDYLTVFVPTTPLPTQGFTLVLPRSETRELPITVEAAIKLVISGGIISQEAEQKA